MRRTTACTLLAGTLLLSACSGDGADAGPALPSADVCDQVGATEVPSECIEGADAVPSRPPVPAGVTSASFEALRIEPFQDELDRVDNNADASRTSATMRVTVPAGARLGLQVACEGYATFSAATMPVSKAAVELECGFDGAPGEIGVESPVAEEAATTYVITVGAPAPARWAAVAYSTTAPLVEVA